MAWVALIASGFMETAWAASLAQSKGFTRPVPSLVFAVTVVLSMAGLAYALKTIPIGTAYAIWVGIGATGTVIYGMVALDEPVTVIRVLCVMAIVAGVVGLKFAH